MSHNMPNGKEVVGSRRNNYVNAMDDGTRDDEEMQGIDPLASTGAQDESSMPHAGSNVGTPRYSPTNNGSGEDNNPLASLSVAKYSDSGKAPYGGNSMPYGEENDTAVAISTDQDTKRRNRFLGVIGAAVGLVTISTLIAAILTEGFQQNDIGPDNTQGNNTLPGNGTNSTGAPIPTPNNPPPPAPTNRSTTTGASTPAFNPSTAGSNSSTAPTTSGTAPTGAPVVTTLPPPRLDGLKSKSGRRSRSATVRHTPSFGELSYTVTPIKNTTTVENAATGSERRSHSVTDHSPSNEFSQSATAAISPSNMQSATGSSRVTHTHTGSPTIPLYDRTIFGIVSADFDDKNGENKRNRTITEMDYGVANIIYFPLFGNTTDSNRGHNNTGHNNTNNNSTNNGDTIMYDTFAQFYGNITQLLPNITKNSTSANITTALLDKFGQLGLEYPDMRYRIIANQTEVAQMLKWPDQAREQLLAMGNPPLTDAEKVFVNRTCEGFKSFYNCIMNRRWDKIADIARIQKMQGDFADDLDKRGMVARHAAIWR